MSQKPWTCPILFSYNGTCRIGSREGLPHVIGWYGQFGRLARPLAMAAVLALAWSTVPARAAPIVVTQSQPNFNTTVRRVSLFQYKTITQSGITIDSAVDRSYAGLAAAIWNLANSQGEKFNQTLYGGDFAAFVAGRHFGYGIASGDNVVDNGWSASPNADFSEVQLTGAGRNKDIWTCPTLPVMVTSIGFDLAALDADGGWSATDPLDWKVVISQQVLPEGLAVHSATGFTIYAPTYAYTLARPGLPGDANADSYVDVTDLLYLVEAFGSVAGEANYDPACDFNDDDSVDVVDLLTIVENFGV